MSEPIPLFREPAPDPVVQTLRTTRTGFSVWVGGKRVATLSPGVVAVCGIRVGSSWNAEIAAAAAHATQIEHIKHAATRLLRISPRSRATLHQRLCAKGFAPSDVDAALDELARAGVLDDARSAAARVSARKPTTSAALDQKLRAQGYDAAARAEAIRSGVDQGAVQSAESVARALLQAQLAKWSRLDQVTAARRAFALLARHNIDESIAEDVVRSMFKMHDAE